jgi:hypothetical protein
MRLGDNDGRGKVYDRFGTLILEEGETVEATRKAEALALFEPAAHRAGGPVSVVGSGSAPASR